MGQVLGSVSATNNTASYTIVDVPSPGVFGPTVVNNYTTLSVPAYFRALNFKSSNMASFPRSVQQNGIDVVHRLNKIIKRKPNDYQSPTMLFRTWFFHKYHYANGFIEIERDSLFNVKALHNRPPELVAAFRWMDDDGQVSGWYWVGGVKPRIVAAADMMHLTGLSYDGLSGMYPCWIHAETFERARLGDRYITRFLVKGGIIKGSIRIPAGLSEEQQDAIVNQIMKYRGADAEGDIILLSGGAELTNNSISNDQSQLIQLHDLSDVQIAQLTDVHPYFLFADKNGKYNNSPEQAGEDIVRYLFRLEIEQAEDELLKLLPEDEQDSGFEIKIDPSALIRGDVETEAAIVTQLTNGGLISRNEGRQEIGYPASNDPEADKLKTLGDTAPPKPVQPDENKPQKASKTVSVESFAALIGDAANRIGNKVDKATTTAQKKSTGESFTRWGNVFANEIEGNVIEAITPILTTIASLTEAEAQPVAPQDVAAKIGSTYANQLRGHFSRLIRNEASTPPDLQAITLTVMKGNNHD